MIPTHYLEIALGLFAGVPIGLFVASLFYARKIRRITIREWREARDFYLNNQ